MKEAEVLLSAIREAGAAICALQATGFTISRKANQDLLTQGDLLANEILKAQLQQNFPDVGWLSEESADNAERLQCERVWVVDPIDGTREFAAGIPEYAISVALVVQGTPQLAAVYNPATDELFYAIKNQGAFLNNSRIYCRSDDQEKLLLLASRSEFRRGEWRAFESAHNVKAVGSIAYKLALIASGVADATFSLGPKSEWDIAAGTLLVTEAGGIVTDKKKQPFVFNQPNVIVNGIVATSTKINQKIFKLISGS